MTIENILFLLIDLASFGVFLFFAYKLFKIMLLGKPEKRFDNIPERIKGVLIFVLGQQKLLREPLAGIMHFTIFWGFVILTIGTTEVIFNGIYNKLSFEFLGPLYSILLLAQDLFGAFVLIAILYALYRRYISHPARLELSKDHRRDATIILLLIFSLMITMFVTKGAEISMGNIEHVVWMPFSKLTSNIYSGLQYSSQNAFYKFFWWVHILIVLGFLNYLPFSKHLHILSAVPNVYLKSTEPKGALKPINLEDESVQVYGVGKIEDFTWKDLLDSYTCTECGRCSSKCPATQTQKPLSPMNIVRFMRAHLKEKAPILLATKNPNNPELPEELKNIANKNLIGDVIKEEELWACTTCRACMQECPVLIEHVPKIIDMRRYLVLMEGKIAPEVQTSLKNIEINSNPWGIGLSTRADWSKGMDIKIIAEEDKNVDILYYVGCSGAFDERYKKVSNAMIKILKKAGINFGILGVEEACCGDSARRIGNEYLAQILIKQNIETFNRYNIKKILTACPHCYNIFKNEYIQFGGRYEVIHHTDFIIDLIRENKLKLNPRSNGKITYHDSCYLGRYNDIYKQPRNIIKAVSGAKPIEMPRYGDRNFCCGAGGGRMWMEETIGKRINVERVEEAISTKADIIGTACPYCMTMFSDALTQKEAQDKVKVLDIAELAEQAL